MTSARTSVVAESSVRPAIAAIPLRRSNFIAIPLSMGAVCTHPPAIVRGSRQNAKRARPGVEHAPPPRSASSAAVRDGSGLLFLPRDLDDRPKGARVGAPAQSLDRTVHDRRDHRAMAPFLS